jgi:hypothetical protein
MVGAPTAVDDNELILDLGKKKKKKKKEGAAEAEVGLQHPQALALMQHSRCCAAHGRPRRPLAARHTPPPGLRACAAGCRAARRARPARELVHQRRARARSCP